LRSQSLLESLGLSRTGFKGSSLVTRGFDFLSKGSKFERVSLSALLTLKLGPLLCALRFPLSKLVFNFFSSASALDLAKLVKSEENR
jgi:hypothetical protein